MSHVVMHVWRVSRAAVVPAVLRMAVDRLHLSSAPGLGFSKLLGTGDGRTFDVRDADVRTWALLTTWESAAASREFEGHRTPCGWRRIAEEEYRVDLACLRTRGRWGGRAPFAVDEGLARRWDWPVASLTRGADTPADVVEVPARRPAGRGRPRRRRSPLGARFASVRCTRP